MQFNICDLLIDIFDSVQIRIFNQIDYFAELQFLITRQFNNRYYSQSKSPFTVNLVHYFLEIFKDTEISIKTFSREVENVFTPQPNVVTTEKVFSKTFYFINCPNSKCHCK